MTLSDFIGSNLEPLLNDWTNYARSVSPGDSHLNEVQLRNSGQALLTGIAADMREPQTEDEQHEKSQGARTDFNSAFTRAGREHANDRLTHGFAINALVAEFRALRASVLRRWQQSSQLDEAAFQEMIRFNEAIDQMLSESVQEFTKRVDRVRDLFAGVLAHDLRSPVQAIAASAHVLLQDENLSPTSIRAGANLQRSAERVKIMIDDLFTFTRARLGDKLPIEPSQQDFAHICHDAVDEVSAASPEAQIEVHLKDDLTGVWDRARMSQLIVNLLTNAVKHGEGIIRLEVAGGSEKINLAVSNGGAPIPAAALPTLFDPLTRASPSPERKRISSGMGLGLYICRCIVNAHSGTIAVSSDDTGTVFTVEIPRLPPSLQHSV